MGASQLLGRSSGSNVTESHAPSKINNETVEPLNIYKRHWEANLHCPFMSYEKPATALSIQAHNVMTC